MKISKLFHWLYAILMLLPFVFFVPSVLYYAFNDNATMQTVEVPKTETIAIDFNQLVNENDLTNGTYNLSGVTIVIQDGQINLSGQPTSNEFALYPVRVEFEENHKYLAKTNLQGNISSGATTWQVYIYGGLTFYDVSDFIFVASTNTISYFQFAFYSTPNNNLQVSFNYQLFDLTRMFGAGNEPTLAEFNNLFPSAFYSYTESELMQITYDTGETEQLVQNTDIVNYAWESIWNLPLFSWCKVSFVATPFTFITGLFGLAPSNSFNYVFTYFASMSIIWLVFDVVLYVPLLVHRWLDKGIVE